MAEGICPICRKSTIRRMFGEWCPRCVGFIAEQFHPGQGFIRVVKRPM